MIRRIHELKRHEEGQALVLAAITMLILTLCVMATVNLSYAVHQKMQLQDSADAVAYTTAAYQARALNFFAYTNRAMVVQYCAQMNLMALLTYLNFEIILFTMVLSALALLFPPIETVVQVVNQVLHYILVGLKIFVAIALPALDIINYFTGLTQFAVSTDMAARILAGPQNELSRINSDLHRKYVMDDLASTLLNLAGAVRWERTVLTNPIPTLAPPTNEEESFDRALMTEIANGARHKWTAFGGDKAGFPNLVARHFDWNAFGVLKLQRTARTEWGSFGAKPGLGLGGIFNFLSNISSNTEQIYSADALLFEINVPSLGNVLRIQYGIVGRADRQLWRTPHLEGKVDFKMCQGGGFFWRLACNAFMRTFAAGFTAAIRAGVAAANAQIASMESPDIPLFHFGMAPYARFRPGPGGSKWNQPSAAELFNQPPVVLMLTEPSADIVDHGRPFMGKFGARMGSLSSANSALQHEAGTHITQPSGGWHDDAADLRTRNLTMGFMQDGFHAVATAVAYYHRPGDWREPPNLFNPFWGAKLMPVVDYPAIANAPVLGSLLSQKFMVH